MSEATTTPAAPAAASEPAPEAAAVETEATPAPAEGEVSETTAAPEGEAPPPAVEEPPRLAAAKKMLDQAKKLEATVKERESALETERATFTKEVERIKGIIDNARPAFDLGRDLYALQGQPLGKLLARLKTAGFDVRPQELAALVIEGDEEDRPLTRRELLQIEKDRETKLQAQADAERKAREQQAQTTRAQQEATFLSLAKAQPNVAALVEAFDDSAPELILKDAYAAKAARDARREPYTHVDLLADVEKRAGERLAKLRGPAPAAPTTSTAVKGGASLSNRTTAAPASGKPKSKEERWEAALRDL